MTTNTNNTLDFDGQDIVFNSKHICTTALSVTSSTTPVAITGLTGVCQSGGIYIIEGHLSGTAAASGGIKLTFGGTATFSAVNITTWDYNGTTLNAVTNITASSSSLMANAAAYTDVIIQGVLVCTNGGTVILQMGQNTSNATSSTVAVNSYLRVSRE